ncbi:MAG: pyridoxamine 5'-phosphate oxidase family protein [Muribaculaceae bacterium]|nr:pyridoxamine 5'-phosphate oxidase family protein [Muribaculaceae bacterium]MBR1727388.1 pyridoxamine 5'-phosphate oxidase family protein [Muribaculaceae bacterium]
MEAVKKVYDFLEDAKSFYLATVEGDQPRVRVYGAILMFEDNLYLMAFARTNATKQIASNPKAEICAFKGKTLRVTCKLVEDNRQAVKDAMMAKMPSLKPITGEAGENAVMLRVTEATATFFNLMEPVETITF